MKNFKKLLNDKLENAGKPWRIEKQDVMILFDNGDYQCTGLLHDEFGTVGFHYCSIKQRMIIDYGEDLESFPLE